MPVRRGIQCSTWRARRGWSTGGHPAREFRDIRLLAVTTATGWTRPRAGFAPIASWRSFSLPSKLISARSGDRGEDREVRDEKKIGKCPRASLHCILLSVSYWHGLCEPRLVQVEQNNQRINTTLLSHYPIPLRNEIKKVKIPG